MTRVVVVGAGIGGLCAAIDLAVRGVEVLVLERAASVGGKLRRQFSGGYAIDAGPTVFTMPWVFENLFQRAGADFHDYVQIERADCLARHFWQDGEQLDLYADLERSVAAIARFANVEEGRRFEQFITKARGVYQALRGPFLESSKPNPLSLSWRIGLRKAFTIQPFHKLMAVLEKQFTEPRLRQLFGRYATYCGASPYQATATLMLIAYVEQEGVYCLHGGMYSLAQALARLAGELGVEVRCSTEVAEVATEGSGFRLLTDTQTLFRADRVILNTDAAAIAEGLLGAQPARGLARVNPQSRSLSAVTWCFRGRPTGAALNHHNVFFADDYRREFDSLFAHRELPTDPTVYLCAQSRSGAIDHAAATADETFLCLINAPPDGDTHAYANREIEQCKTNMMNNLQRCGVQLQPTSSMQVTSPADFARLFPGSGGAIYGRASHGWMSTFQRAGNRSRLPGLYHAGGSVHPGPGVPMAALSGRLAAEALLKDSISRSRSIATAMPGGISMH